MDRCDATARVHLACARAVMGEPGLVVTNHACVSRGLRGRWLADALRAYGKFHAAGKQQCPGIVLTASQISSRISRNLRQGQPLVS